MTRDTTGGGRPGWRLFPNQWEAHHYPIANQQATGTVNLWTGPKKDVLNRDTGEYTVTYGTKISPGPVPARLQQISQPSVITAGGEEITIHEYRCTIDAALAVDMDGWIEIAEASDATLPGRWFKVTDVQRGTLRWQRDLICTDNLDD